MLKKCFWILIGSILILFSGFSRAWADEQKNAPLDLASYDPKTLVFVANRDSSDIAVIDTQTDQVVRRIALGKYANPHMAMLSHNGKKLLVSATGRDRFLVVDLATEAIERTIETGQAPEHFAITMDDRFAYVGNMEDSTVSVIDLKEGKEVRRLKDFLSRTASACCPETIRSMSPISARTR
ncbi:MAG: beta-propeller fold lactonase family protein (plasmid) [Candidatus Manganitrophus sp.]|nr:MAG: beta-propeller fold lactonase family protein [Candidatus Manganitrophus sp.]